MSPLILVLVGYLAGILPVGGLLWVEQKRSARLHAALLLVHAQPSAAKAVTGDTPTSVRAQKDVPGLQTRPIGLTQR